MANVRSSQEAIEFGPGPFIDDDGFCPHGLAAGVGCSVCERWCYVRCHICGKVKDSSNDAIALHKLAFHYDRRHRGWTDNLTQIRRSESEWQD